MLHVVFSSNNSGSRVGLLRNTTSSVTTGDERWIRTVLKDPHPVVTQRGSERAEWTPITTEETPTSSIRQNPRRDISCERLMDSGIFSIAGDHEGHKQRLPTPYLFRPRATNPPSGASSTIKNQLAHGHFSKVKERTLCRDGIPGATQCPVRELSLMRETTDERRTR